MERQRGKSDKNYNAAVDTVRDTDTMKCSGCTELHAKQELNLLECCHAFCEACLSKSASFDESGTLLYCQLCKTMKQKTRSLLARSGDLSSLPTTEELNTNRVAEVTRITSSGLPACSVCQKENPTFYCCNCIGFFGKKCFDSHQEFFEDHKILELETLQESSIPTLFRRLIFCRDQKHMNKLVKYFCKTCQRCLCEVCLFDHPTWHLTVGLDIAATEQQAIFRERLEQLDAKATAEEEKLSVIKDRVCEISRQAEHVKLQVNKDAEDAINCIEENKKYLMGQIDEEVESAMSCKEKQQLLLQQICESRNHVNKLSDESATTWHLMESKHLVEARMNELLKKQVVALEDLDRQIEFMPNTAKLDELQVCGLGSVRAFTTVDQSKCSVEIVSHEHLNFEALEVVSLLVHFRNCSGEYNRKCPRSDVDVAFEPSEDIRDVQVTENIDGKCCVEFTPRFPGKVKVNVMVRGQHVSNSPLLLTIKPETLKYINEFVIKGINQPLKRARGIAINKPNTKIAITYFGSRCVCVCNLDGKLLKKISINGQNALDGPHGVAFLNGNDIIVSDSGNSRMVLFDTNTGEVLKCFGRRGKGPGEFHYPCDVHVDSRGRIIVCDGKNKRIQIFRGNGEFLLQFSKEGLLSPFDPRGVTSYGDQLIVSDYLNHVLHVLDLRESHSSVEFVRQTMIGWWSTGNSLFYCPHGVAIDRVGNILVCVVGDQRVLKLTLDGRFVGQTYYYKLGNVFYMDVTDGGQILVVRNHPNNDVLIFE